MNIDKQAAEKILTADFANLIKKVQRGKTLTAQERQLVQARSLGVDSATAKAKNKVELAQILGVSRKTIDRKAKDPDSPKPAANGEWDVVAWREFLKHKGIAGKEDLPEKERLSARRLLVQCERLEFELDMRKREYVRRAEVAGALTATATRVAAILRQRLENEYPMQVAGLDAPQARVYGKRVVDEVLREVQGLAEIWV